MFTKQFINSVSEFINSRNVIMMTLALATLATFIILGGCDATDVVTALIIPGVAAGKHISDEPLTLDLAAEASPGLLRNEIDDRIVKIRPMSTPVDQISRYAGARLCGSMVVDYYSVDTKPVTATCTGCTPSTTVNGFRQSKVNLDNALIFEPTETVMVPDVKASDGGSLVLYVTNRATDSITAIAVNNKDDDGTWVVPEIPTGSMLVRMGRAAAELDVQTAQYESLPVKSRNFCQIFKSQVEQSTYMKIANKEVGWTFNDQEESAIIDMRLGMEKNFLFGSRARIFDPVKRNEILLTGGIWNQAGGVHDYDRGNMTFDNLVEMSRKAFTGNAGSSKKILIAGSLLIEALNKLEHTKVISAGETMTRWGLDFSEIVTKFGRLYVIMSEVFDQCGHAHDGLIIDPEYLSKYTHVPFRTERLDLRASGQRNTDAIVITEASCLVLRYPAAHVRVIARD